MTPSIAGSGFELEVTPSDGSVRGETATSDAMTVVNAPPSVASVTIGPDAPLVGSTISAVIDGIADPDGDAVLLGYAWLVGGAYASTAETLDGGLTSEGDAIQLFLTYGDGRSDATTIGSNVLVAVAPSVLTAEVTPADPDSNLDDLVCVVTSADSSLDPARVVYTAAWTINGMAWTGPTTTTSYAADTIPAALVRPSATYECTVTASDGTGSLRAVASVVTRPVHDLVVDGSDPALSCGSVSGCLELTAGNYDFADVAVVNGGVVRISGFVVLRAHTLTVDEESIIDGYGGGAAPALGEQGGGSGGGGAGTDGGAGGGGYGGEGGLGGFGPSGAPGAGGGANGDPTSLALRIGSAGGSASNALGGAGGAALFVSAPTISIRGSIDVRGASADEPSIGAGGGGGSGGGILLSGIQVDIGGALVADGGAGSVGASDASPSGGGGGGGRIEILSSAGDLTGRISVRGGAGGPHGEARGATDGSDGSANVVVR